MAFADSLQALMGAKGISRRRLANGCGIGPGAVGPWFDRSAGNIGLQALERLSEYFGIGMEELVRGAGTRHGPVFTGDTCTGGELSRIRQFAHFSVKRGERNG